ncbi:MAG TPA: TonB-dependent receptor [Candidatus Acidoferrales bacterium]|nr:TonB-dependent receptor [Candidatus Acidoferrales bacterium]
MQLSEASNARLFRWGLRWIATFILILGVSYCASAQSTATILGTVTDASNAPVPNATVLIHNENTGVERTTKTDDSGNYVMPGLLPGLYQVSISGAGFQTYVVNDLKLDVATTVTANAQLRLGQVTEKVIVNGGAPLVETNNVSVSEVITPEVVQSVPLNGRHFLDLAILTPGTMTPPQNGFLVSPLQGLGSLSIDTAGQRETTLNLLVNGINLNDEVQNQVTFQPSIDTVSEFKIDNSTFPAQYGRNSGAIVNIATMSGTNQFHGEAFDFARNNYFDARNYFNPSGTRMSQLNRHDFGGDFGGPIQKSKMFFFLSYEGLRQHHGIPVETPVPANGTTSSDTTVNNLLALLPGPTGTLSNGTPAFFGSLPTPVNVDIGTGDFSANFTSSDEFHAYYAVEKDHRFEPQSGTNVPNFGDTRDGSRQLLTLGETHLFTPSLTNQVRLGFNRLFITFEPNDSSLNAANIGIGLPPGVPAVGIPSIVIQSLGLEFGNPGGEPQGRGDTTVAFNDTLTWLKGRHTIMFGADVSRFYNNNIGENVGQFVFSSLTNFLNDAPSSFTTLEGNSDDKIVMPAWGIFVQDSFKWRPNITLSLGLRYDWNSTPFEANNKFAVFDPGTDALVTTGQPFQTNNKNVQPRVGIAWDPWGDGKTSVRAGYAILAQQPTTNIVSGLSGNPPFATPIADSSASGAFTLEAPPATPRSVSPFTVNPNYHDAYTQDWNLTIQRSLTDTMGIQIAYVGSKSTHLEQVLNFNQPIVSGGLFEPNANRPYPNFTEIEYVTGNGNSNYNGLWLTFNKKTKNGFEFLATYSYSKSLDYSSLDFPNFLPQDSNNLRAEYGPSDFNATNRVVFSGFYTLPFKGNRAVSGWELAAVSQVQSGNPLTAYMGGVSGLFSGATVRPDVSGPIGVTGNPSQWFTSTSVFSTPCTGSGSTLSCAPGSEGRNMFVGPDFVDTDISLIKDTKITERLNTEFRAEAFDIFNHPAFGDPNLTFGSSTFGVITSTRFPTGDFGSSRQLQLALKFMF